MLASFASFVTHLCMKGEGTHSKNFIEVHGPKPLLSLLSRNGDIDKLKIFAIFAIEQRFLLEPEDIIGSAEALPILCVRYFRWEREREIQRERERERDGSDVTIFALKLAMNLHFPCQKFAQLAMSLHFPLAKNSHFSFLPSHFPSLPSRRGHVALKFAMSSHFP